MSDVTKEYILSTALELVSKDRANTHGDYYFQHETAAKLWSAFLGHTVTASDVATCIGLLKISRMAHGQFNPDDYIDACGYFGIGGACRDIEKRAKDRVERIREELQNDE